jgi:uncharacterized protein YndB with AHSA1/START domain
LRLVTSNCGRGGNTTLFFQHKNLSTRRGTAPEQYKKMDEEGGGFDGKILRCEAPRLLAITWGEKQSSEVTFELTPQTSGEVLLTLTHRRLDKDRHAERRPRLAHASRDSCRAPAWPRAREFLGYASGK